MKSLWVCVASSVIVAGIGSGCAGSKRSSTGWAAEVPANATRFIEQVPKAAACAPVESAPSTVPAPAESPPTAAATPTQPALGATELTLWHSYRATEKAALEQVMAAWSRVQPNVTVKLRAVPFDAFNDKITVVVPEGRGPDLFIFAHDLVGAWSEMGFIEPLSGWTNEADTQGFLPNTVQALVYRNALYGLPLAFKTVALYYDRARIPTPPATTAALIALAKEHSDGKERFGLVYEAANLYFHAPWVHGFGGQILDLESRAHASDPEALLALQFAKDLVSLHKVTPANITTAMVSGYFNDGKAAMVINGPWMRGEISGIDYGVAPLPEVATGQPARPFLGVEAVFMNKRSEHKSVAIALARFLVGAESARIRFEVGKQPVANAAVWADSPKDPTMEAFRMQAEHAVVMPSSPRMQQVWSPYNGALLSVISGDSSPKEALTAAQAQIEADMARAAGGAP